MTLANQDRAADWHDGCDDALTFNPMSDYAHDKGLYAFRED
jgi:hypothetical protein